MSTIPSSIALESSKLYVYVSGLLVQESVVLCSVRVAGGMAVGTVAWNPPQDGSRVADFIKEVFQGE